MAKKTITSPKARAGWTSLDAPSTKFNPEGKYEVKYRLTPSPETTKYLKELDAANDAAYDEQIEAINRDPKKGAKVSSKVSKRELYEEEEDGSVTLKATMTATGTRKKDGMAWSQKPALFDAKGTPITGGVRVGQGSLIKVSIEPYSYFMASTKTAGISLRLKAVQIIELVEFGGGDASAFGFESEDGFEASSAPAPSAAAAHGFSNEATTTPEDEDGEGDDF